ncbi:GumC family protein [Methylobacterium sp. WL120]|uniref:GumC family protein n=1 Tax=Methylobacterium sp. WL120 TaxID=2603887 RepID=UPI002484B5DF|nr:GumC family protein [Methylobacterium sp. WL120]
MPRPASNGFQDWPVQARVIRLHEDTVPVWHVLQKRKLLLAMTMVLGAALAASFVLYFPRNYTSETQILEDPRGLKIFSSEDLTPQGQAADMTTALVETQLRVLTSDSVLQRVVARLDLTHDPEFDGSERNPIQAAIEFIKRRLGSDGKAEPLETVALRSLQDKVRAQRLDRGFVIQLQVTAHDADKAASLGLAVAKTYIEGEALAKRETARRAGGEVRDRLDDLATRVKQAEEAVEAFKVKNRLVGASGELVSAQELSALNLQIVTAQTKTSELKARADQIQSLAKSGVVPDNLPESVKSSTITSLRTQFAEADRLQADAAARLGPRHPDTLSLRNQIDRLRGQINAELSRIAAAARSEYERARVNDQALARSLQSLKTQALDVSQSLVRLRELERKAQASRTVYESYLARSREIGEQQGVDTGNVRIISPPLPPNKPTGPPATLIVLAGGVLGIALAAASAMLFEGVRRRSAL